MIPLSLAKLCLGCESIYIENTCPICASEKYIWLQKCLGSLNGRNNGEENEENKVQG
jgi:hypothetical protein